MVTPLGIPMSESDVVVIGGGPAGIAAAACAAERGVRVKLMDESPEVGGQIWRHRAGGAMPDIARTWITRLEGSGAKILRATAVVDVRAEGGTFVVTAERNGVPLLLRARAIVLATGARERFLPFAGWTMPGVIGVGAAQALLKAGMSVAGKRVVIAGSGPLLLPVAAALRESGATVLLVAEQASRSAVAKFAIGLLRRPATLLQAARYRAGFRKAPYHFGEWVSAARGDGHVEEVDITNGSSTRTIRCDILSSAFGLVPNTELAQLLGCEIAGGSVVVDGRQQTTHANVFCAGEPTGIGGMELATVEGEIAGLSAAGHAASPAFMARRDTLRTMAAAMERAFAPRAELRALAMPDTIVCRCEDVRLGAIDSHWTMRKAKLYTRAGMGPCQGRVCGAALEFLYGWSADVVRLPAEPALFSTLIAESATTSPAANHGA